MNTERRIQKTEFRIPRTRITRRVLECGDSSPLFLGSTQSSDQSEHSKTWRLALAFCSLAVAFCLCAHAQTNYTLDWSAVDGGGGTSAGSVYSVTGTIGQNDIGGVK